MRNNFLTGSGARVFNGEDKISAFQGWVCMDLGLNGLVLVVQDMVGLELDGFGLIGLNWLNLGGLL